MVLWDIRYLEAQPSQDFFQLETVPYPLLFSLAISTTRQLSNMPPFGSAPVGGDESQAVLFLGITWSLTSFSTLVFLCRLWTRVVIIKKPRLDDAVIGLAVVLNLVAAAMVVASTNYGMGRHEYYLTLPQLSQSIKDNIILQTFGALAIPLPKLGIAILIVDILRPSKPWVWALYTSTVALIVSTVIIDILQFAQCSPVNGLWDPTVSHTCWNPEVYALITLCLSAYSALLDFALALFPITVLRKLQMKTSRKIGLSIMMGLGVFAGVCACIKTSLVPLRTQPDFTWDTTILLIWGG